MLNTDKKLYTERITTVSNEINILENNSVLSQRLVDKYEHICNMVTIDYETSNLVKQLPDDITAKILGQLEELKAIEARKRIMFLMVNLQQSLYLDKKILTTLG